MVADHGDAVIVQPISYWQLVLGAMIAVTVFGEVLRWNTVVGAIIVVGAGLFTVWREWVVSRRAKRAEEEARVWPRRNIITRAIGVTEVPHCDLRTDRVRVDDAFLLCSDGLHGEMADADYGYVGSGKGKITLYKGKEVMKKSVPSEKAVDELINIIREDGSRDSIDVLCRIDTLNEVEYFKAGGILHYVLRQMIAN